MQENRQPVDTRTSRYRYKYSTIPVKQNYEWDTTTAKDYPNLIQVKYRMYCTSSHQLQVGLSKLFLTCKVGFDKLDRQ